MTPKELIQKLKSNGKKVTLAESCTGGLVAAALTAVPGSSEVFDRGFVTYSNASKNEILGVPKTTLKKYGAVSEQTAIAMAKGALRNSNADVAISVTGIAGPGGGSLSKPVGLVHFARVAKGQKTVVVKIKLGNLGRNEIRKRSVKKALSLLEQFALRKHVHRAGFKS
jgi:nicotinamide-nucleotide amidase